LADSIKEKGLLEPILIRPLDNDNYEIIHGERRLRACQLAGMEKIECQVRDATPQQAYEMAIIENVQRQDLTPTEEARALQHLVETGLKQDAIGKLIGKGQSYVAHKLRLLKMPEPITFYLDKGALTENHIRQIAKLEGIYGDDLLRGLPDDIEPIEITTSEIAAKFLYRIRPEAKIIIVEPSENQQVVVDACQQMENYVSKHNSKTLQWVVAGFWWASMAVMLNLTVAHLAVALVNWEERYNTALFYWYENYNGKPVPVHVQKKNDYGDNETALYWGYFSDLRFSASLRAEGKKIMSDEARLKRFDGIYNGAGGTYPTEMDMSILGAINLS
jgi:ParB/RepB/Spo0J family partition protein